MFIPEYPKFPYADWGFRGDAYCTRYRLVNGMSYAAHDFEKGSTEAI